MGFRPLYLGHPDYPTLLAECPDAPAFLWASGDISLATRDCVALVGARNASALGRRVAANLATGLGENKYIVVSGLARGIDAAVHTASLATGTIAVQAGGLDIVYPKENADLTMQIGEQGLRLSEQPIGLIPQARHFPQRNRIIAGLSLAVTVIEGAARSGSLITARNAADLGRDVMAVPGNPMDGRATGCNMLIRDGATLIRDANDIIEALSHHVNINPSTEQQVMHLAESTNEDVLPPPQIVDCILNMLGPNAIPEDDIIRDSGLPARDVAQQLTTLELSGKIARHPGGMLALSA